MLKTVALLIVFEETVIEKISGFFNECKVLYRHKYFVTLKIAFLSILTNLMCTFVIKVLISFRKKCLLDPTNLYGVLMQVHTS